MNKQYKLIFQSPKMYKEFSVPNEVPSFYIGTDPKSLCRFYQEHFKEPFSLTFYQEKDRFILRSENLYSLKKKNAQLSRNLSIEIDEPVLLLDASNNPVLSLELAPDYSYEDFSLAVPIFEYESFMISSSNQALIRLTDPAADNHGARIFRQNGFWWIEPVGQSRFYINGLRIRARQRLSDLDFISMGPYCFCYQHGMLYTDKNTTAILPGNTKDVSESKTGLSYPFFNRSARIIEPLSTSEIEILDPPSEITKPRSNLVAQILPSLSMIGILMLLGNSSYMMLSGAMMGVGIGTSLYSYYNTRKEYKQDVRNRREVYSRYIEHKSMDIEHAQQREVNILKSLYYDPFTELQMVEDYSPNLFERIPSDPDFLELYLGTGSRKAAAPITSNQRERVEAKDDLMNIPERLAEQYEYIANCPITLPLQDVSVLGITGARPVLKNFMDLMILDLSTRHFFSDVHLMFFLNSQDEEDYNWLRYLPHTRNSELKRRSIAIDEESRGLLLEYLYKQLNGRSEQSDQNPLAPESHIVVFVYRKEDLMTHPIALLLDQASEKRIHFIFLEESLDLLPKECSEIIFLDQESGNRINTKNGTDFDRFSFMPLQVADLYRYAKKLAPVKYDEISLESTLTKYIDFYSLYHIYRPEDINLERQWAASQVYDSMAAPLGVKANGSTLSLDLHERFHGPHGLVAGTTGSGKSEILQSYLLSMALKFHPYDVAFVIIDYKGGSLAQQFAQLPHLIGSITNIDGGDEGISSDDIERSLLSIRAELTRRQRLFHDYEVNHIDDYIKLFKKGVAPVPLPHLILVVDEFAELKTDQPDFMKELVSTARIGRSLGIHLILATQRPTGIIDPQIESNSRFKLCLKVQSKSDSNEILKNPLAAEITEPGRAYLQVGNNEVFDLFQSAYSGASSDVAQSSQKSFSISSVDLCGRKKVLYQKKAKKNEEAISQSQKLVSYIHDSFENLHVPALDPIYLPPLAASIPFPDEVQLKKLVQGKERQEAGVYAYLGLMDDPSRQLQEMFSINLSRDQMIILGSSGKGKTNVLQSILRSVATCYSPKQASFYILDFGNMGLSKFQSLPHVGDVALFNEDEKIGNLFKMLVQESARRKTILQKAGMTSFTSYLESGFDDLGQIIVMIDNMTGFKELYLDTGDDFLLPILREASSVGISFILTNNASAGISFRYLSNLARKMSLHLNDKLEYASLFESARKQPKDINGRVIFNESNQIYDGQIFLAFEGEREVDRNKEIDAFIQSCQKIYPCQAKRVPVVPARLTEQIMLEQFDKENTDTLFYIGIDFENIQPVSLQFEELSILSLSGDAKYGKDTFEKKLLQMILEQQGELVIADTKKSLLQSFDQNLQTLAYSNATADLMDLFDTFMEAANERFDAQQERGRPLVLVLQSDEYLSLLDQDKKRKEQFRQIAAHGAEINAHILIGSLPNTNITFSSPDLLKLIRDKNRDMIIFENLDAINLIDISLATKRKFPRKLQENEGYSLLNGTFQKIRTIE